MRVEIDGVEYVPRIQPVVYRDETLGQLLMRCRKHCGFSLEQAAEEVPCSKPYLWELEQDRARNPTLRLCLGLASLYGLTLDRMAAHLNNAAAGPRAS